MTIERGSTRRAIGFELEGERLIADPSGALYWPSEAMLIVADLHFEKGSSFARGGIFLPPYDTRATVKALEIAVDRFQPKRIIALGDSFHDAQSSERISQRERQSLQSLMKGREWIWVLGNHDPAPPRDLGGVSLDEVALGPLVFRHEPRAGASVGEIAGHLHPCATLHAKGRRLRRRCFAFDGTRLVLPAFGTFTGGLCVLDQAFSLVLRSPFTAMLLGRERVYPVRHAWLVPDAA